MYLYKQNLSVRGNDGKVTVMPGATVHIYKRGTEQLAQLFAEDAITMLDQPLVTDSNGYFPFRAVNGEYTATFSSPRFDTFSWEIELFDADDVPKLPEAIAALMRTQESVVEALGIVSNEFNLVDIKIGEIDAQLSERNSVTQHGSVSVAVLNAAIASVKDGTLTIPAGTYDMSGDILIKLKGDANTGGFTLDATGVVFTGSGRIIVDSCKRLSIEGLDAPRHDLMLRSCWFSKFFGLRMRDVVFGDAPGSSFSSNYWDMFEACQFQTIITAPSASQGANKISWNNCQFRGDASQGYDTVRDYFIEYRANQDAQAWDFISCDVSYYANALIYVDPANLEDIQLKFLGTYFDSKFPSLPARSKGRLITEDCMVANDLLPFGVPISQVTHGSQDTWRGDRASGYKSHTGINLIPNGDFYDTLPSYVGAGLPVGSANTAVITPMTGGGMNGRYININQALTASNQVLLRSKSLPMKGRYTAVVVARNADVGAKKINFAAFSLYYDAWLSDAEWSILTLTSGQDLAPGAALDILLRTTDGTPYNIDVCYCGMFLGEAGPLFLPAPRPPVLNASMVYDAPSIASGSQITVNVTVPGAVGGDFARASFGVALQGLDVSAYITGPDTAQVLVRNNTAAAIDLGNTTLRVRVDKFSY